MALLLGLAVTLQAAEAVPRTIGGKTHHVSDELPIENEGSGELILDDEDQDIEGSGAPIEDERTLKEEETTLPFGHGATPEKEDDFHFMDGDKLETENGSDHELYEYYSEYYEEDEDYDLDEDEDEEDEESREGGDDDDDDDYDDDDDDEEDEYDDDDDDEDVSEEIPRVVIYESSPPVVVSPDGGADPTASGPFGPFGKASYLYVLLASTALSFSLALLVFVLCRRSDLERKQRRTKKLLPVFSGKSSSSSSQMRPDLYYHPVALSATSLPSQSIVKNHGKVPSQTRDFLENQNVMATRGKSLRE